MFEKTDYCLRVADSALPFDPQVGFVDGYAVAERLLEGVMFRIELLPNGEGLTELTCTGVREDCQAYYDKFSDTQKAKWQESIVNFATNDGSIEASDGTELYWGEYYE